LAVPCANNIKHSNAEHGTVVFPGKACKQSIGGPEEILLLQTAHAKVFRGHWYL
jgi:hypothetical protein